jgi:hypothetical protein
MNGDKIALTVEELELINAVRQLSTEGRKYLLQRLEQHVGRTTGFHGSPASGKGVRPERTAKDDAISRMAMMLSDLSESLVCDLCSLVEQRWQSLDRIERVAPLRYVAPSRSPAADQAG